MNISVIGPGRWGSFIAWYLNKNGNTIILITHDSDVAAQAKRVVRIQDGKLYEG